MTSCKKTSVDLSPLFGLRYDLDDLGVQAPYEVERFTGKMNVFTRIEHGRDAFDDVDIVMYIGTHRIAQYAESRGSFSPVSVSSFLCEYISMFKLESLGSIDGLRKTVEDFAETVLVVAHAKATKDVGTGEVTTFWTRALCIIEMKKRLSYGQDLSYAHGLRQGVAIAEILLAE